MERISVLMNGYHFGVIWIQSDGSEPVIYVIIDINDYNDDVACRSTQSSGVT